MLYYMDTPDRPIIDTFTPRVPRRRMSNEDAYTQRIYLSKTLEGCFTAAPWGNDCLEMRPQNVIYRVYEFDERDIYEDCVMDTRELMEKQLVPDAEWTNEVWVLWPNLKPKNIYYIELKDYEYSIQEESNYDFFSVIEKVHIDRVDLRDVILVDRLNIVWNNSFNENDKADCFSCTIDNYMYGSKETIETKDIDSLKNSITQLQFKYPHAMSIHHLNELKRILECSGCKLEYF